MKWFLFCVLAGAIGLAAVSCGPQRDFCPTTNPTPDDLSCHANFDAMSMGGTMGSLCDGGSEVVCPDTKHTHVCDMADCPP